MHRLLWWVSLRGAKIMSLEQLILRFGLPLILFGSMVEGEAIVLIGGFLAHRGYFSITLVIICAAIGTFLADQFYFYIGDTRGTTWLEKRPTWQTKIDRVMPWLERYGDMLVLGFRYLYGVRTIIAFAFGLSKYAQRRFALLNGASAAVWAIVMASLGFFFGQAIERLLGDVKRYEIILISALVAIGLGVWLFERWRSGKAHAKAQMAAISVEAKSPGAKV
jgi:membrane protein DedA with SNARE-associated domain